MVSLSSLSLIYLLYWCYPLNFNGQQVLDNGTREIGCVGCRRYIYYIYIMDILWRIYTHICLRVSWYEGIYIGYEVISIEVLVPGYEGISTGVRRGC